MFSLTPLGVGPFSRTSNRSGTKENTENEKDNANVTAIFECYGTLQNFSLPDMFLSHKGKTLHQLLPLQLF